MSLPRRSSKKAQRGAKTDLAQGRVAKRNHNPKIAVQGDFPVVAIGASAGGLEAYTELFKALPPNTGMAFVVVQHLDPSHHSLLADIVSKTTTMPVKEVTSGLKLNPNCAYVIPHNVLMAIEGGAFVLMPRSTEPGRHLSVNFFMRSLAEDRKSRAIGVVLSGTRATELWGRTPSCGDTNERFCGSFKLFRSDGSFMPHEQCPMAEVVSGRTLEVSDEEVHIERPDGSRITVVVSIRPLKNERGEITGAINCFYDITERKQAEQDLREAARRFRFLAESMPQKIFTAKPNGKLDYLNQQWVEYTGLTFEQIKECGWKTFIHSEDLPENLRIWQRSIDSGEPFRFEHRFRRADGNYRWHLSRAVAMRDSNGNITMWIGSNTDIQDVREQEDHLRKIEKMAAAGQLASSIAHEINNPLSSVTNSLYLLEDHANLDESARFYVSIASTELARVSRIVKQSLSYYRVGTVPGDVDLDAIVNESLNIFSEKLKRTGIELKPKVDSGAALVGFSDELRQVVDNLLLNALEAMPGGGRLSISVHESYDWTRHDHKHRKGVRLTIADTGCGIPKDLLTQIFEPFFTTKTEKGTGLGLWILQGIISKHEGVMSLRSSDVKGKNGTIISIFFPSPTRASRTSKLSEAESAA
jgi:PAS domain S-box-containing protein